MKNTDTIVAVITPPGRGAVGILRVSGSRAFEIGRALFKPFPEKPRILVTGSFAARYFCDKGMCVIFVAPKSFTGEDMVEFHLHGGNAIVDGALRAAVEAGARVAEKGEFTKRAFINGKIDLTAAEGMVDMINASAGALVRGGSNNLAGGRLHKLVNDIIDGLVSLVAQIEAALDYPEENLEEQINTEQAARDALSKVETVLKAATASRNIREGVGVAIAGKTNVGKSSLINAMLGYERVIVTDIAGTTRDVVGETVIIEDMSFRLMDTAGLRETSDTVEKIGVERSRVAIKECDVLIYVADSVLDGEESRFLEILDKPFILVYNKSDLRNFADSAYVLKQSIQSDGDADLNPPRAHDFSSAHLSNANLKRSIEVSALTGAGIEDLKETVYGIFKGKLEDMDNLALINIRQEDCLSRARVSLMRTVNLCSTYSTMDILSAELYCAVNALSEITGRNACDEIINAVFEKFCLGK